VLIESVIEEELLEQHYPAKEHLLSYCLNEKFDNFPCFKFCEEEIGWFDNFPCFKFCEEEIGWKRKKNYFFDEVGHLLVKFPFWGKCPALKMLITQAT